MAKSPNGPYSHPNGKIGGVVHYMLKGQCISRIVGVPPEKRSIKQKANQQAMSVIMNALRPALRFINAGFELQARNTVWNPHNLAVSYNKKHALTGQYPKLAVDYSKLRFSTGTVPLADHLKMEKEGTGIRISWDPQTHPDQGDYADDMVMVLALFPSKNKADCVLNATQRGTGHCFFDLDQAAGKHAEIYVCFKSSDGTAISETAYLGNPNAAEDEVKNVVIPPKETNIPARFQVVEATYLKLIAENGGVKPKHKSFRMVEKKYEALKRRLKGLPGTPS